MKNSYNITLKNINKSYQKGKNTVVVHHDFNLTIKSGEFVALMGPSGLGKSTLLHLMGGLDQPTSGEVIIGTQRIDHLKQAALTQWRAENIGFVFQSHHLLPVLSAQGNVELPLALTSLNKKQRQEHASYALELVGMSERASHFPKELSGGQEQRVAIARAIVSDPHILLCDEPTGNLDRKTANEILALLDQLNRDFGKTIVMVTHDKKAADYASRLINLESYIGEEHNCYMGESR
ncbi:ABC transporter ATP-binding protein [Colwellia sp. BRX10-1]|nr:MULTISPECIES: ABC transporter ATP-binding protein [unclassified Colwellia]MBA6379448.1 ABC transporter ATP-binding protein [Colwellia sp. BRX10-7]MBA6385707.1 ABC transporter ATP-binding protein [Colwellia sp. BRX10-2]MBA6400771.1 ABC transporter ATP-binding protein [Colwellia sp. BRX10-5]MBA6405381.1 ABC transporter ATP-binding protein [Colwellia sp. BRX10-1]